MDKNFKKLLLLSLAIIVLGSGAYVISKPWLVGALSTNIYSSPNDHWAWNDVIGWLDFYKYQNVQVGSQRITGVVSSSIGDIILSCKNTPGNCGDSAGDWGVVNDLNGNLSGWVWNDNVGWFSFCGTTVLGYATSNCPFNVTSTYRVIVKSTSSIDAEPYDFFGWAWNDVLGWVSFNCSDLNPGQGKCDLADSTSYANGYKVRTTWSATSTYGDLYSTVFDTQSLYPVDYNSIAWVGNLPGGTDVTFQFAVRNDCSGGVDPVSCADDTWNFVGPGNSPSTFYPLSIYDSGSGVYYSDLSSEFSNSGRYFRYRIHLKSDSTQTHTPTIYKVNVNWGY